MRKTRILLTIITYVFAITASVICSCGLIFDVARADDTASDAIYIYVAPANLAEDEYAGSTAIPVSGDVGDPLFYLIESYYYQVKIKKHSYELVLPYSVGQDNVFYVEFDDFAKEQAKPYVGVTPETALPSQNLLTKQSITIDGVEIDSQSWTIKLLGVNGDDFFVLAQKDDESVFGLAPKSSFTDENVPYHAISQAERARILAGDEPVDNSVDAPKTSKTLRVILIIGICVPALIIGILIFKPNRNEKGGYDKRAMRSRGQEYDRDREYDDRDYRHNDRRYDRRYDDERDRREYNYRRRDERDYRDDDYQRRDERDYRDERDDRDYRDRNRNYRRDRDYR